MEKYAVDLDAVLDEFEFHEGQASLAGPPPCPSVTGFFSPTEEIPPSLPLPSSLLFQQPPPYPPLSSGRYDLPASPIPLPVQKEQEQEQEKEQKQKQEQEQVPQHVVEIGQPQDEHEETEETEEEHASPPPSYSRQETREDTSSLTSQPSLEKEQEQEQELNQDQDINAAFEKMKKEMMEAREVEDVGLEEEAEGEIIAEPIEGVGPVAEVAEGAGVEVFPARVKDQGAAGGRSLQEELQEVQQGGRREDDYVAQEEVEEYLELIKQEGENYVDEAQVAEYLKQLKLEKSEEELLALCPEEEEDESREEEVSQEEVSREEEVSRDEVSREEGEVEEGMEEAASWLAATDQAVPEALTVVKGKEEQEAGEKMIQALQEVIQEQEVRQVVRQEQEYSAATVLATLGSLEEDLEPVIAVQREVVEEVEVYREEAEYLELGEGELVPQLPAPAGPPMDSIPPSEPGPLTVLESPPPYSEVDPRLLARPTSLDLDNPVEEEEGAGGAVLGPAGATPSNPGGPREGGGADPLAGLSEEQLLLGKVQPFWVPDSDAPGCMICGARFTLVKRRHHCRACGKVLCAACCGDKHALFYLENKEGRVCTPCRTVLERLEGASSSHSSSHALDTPPAPDPGVSLGARPRPNPANPMEYCSTVPVADQVAAGSSCPPPSVLVPVGVLKRGPGEGEERNGSVENKSVMFSDGIRPGGDLTELDGRGAEHRTLGRRPGRGRKARGRGGPAGAQDVAASLLPEEGLPLVSGKGAVEEEEVIVWFSAGTYVSFVMNKNLSVVVKRLHYPPVNKLCWNLATRGLTSVGQDEVVILLEVAEDEQLPPREVFTMLQSLYEQAGAGSPVAEMGHIAVGPEYLGSSSHGGWLFIRHSHQTVADLLLPPPPLLFGVLIMRWEVPWARVAPLRLMLRLGAEFRYYPAPLVSVRCRKPVYGEIGHTIMNVLADFKNYTYALPTIRGLVIHMSPGRTNILIPKNRYESIVKALNTSNETVLALGANFSHSADSHLVAMQGEDGSYQTQAINILNKERKVTGASFVVFNGALKSTANLTAKSSIVEDGLMVQVLPDHMALVRKALRDMQPHLVPCGPTGAEQPDEVVSIVWVDEDKAFNIGIKSVLDGKPMDGISSLRIHSGPDMTQDRCLIRWTEVFLINSGDRPGGAPANSEPPAPARAAEGIARAVSVALLPHLTRLKEEGLTPLAVRVTLEPDNVQYEAGAGGAPLPPAFTPSLDNELVPLLHSGTLTTGSGSLGLELLFHILDH